MVYAIKDTKTICNYILPLIKVSPTLLLVSPQQVIRDLGEKFMTLEREFEKLNLPSSQKDKYLSLHLIKWLKKSTPLDIIKLAHHFDFDAYLEIELPSKKINRPPFSNTN